MKANRPRLTPLKTNASSSKTVYRDSSSLSCRIELLS